MFLLTYFVNELDVFIKSTGQSQCGVYHAVFGYLVGKPAPTEAHTVSAKRRWPYVLLLSL